MSDTDLELSLWRLLMLVRAALCANPGIDSLKLEHGLVSWQCDPNQNRIHSSMKINRQDYGVFLQSLRNGRQIPGIPDTIALDVVHTYNGDLLSGTHWSSLPRVNHFLGESFSSAQEVESALSGIRPDVQDFLVVLASAQGLRWSTPEVDSEQPLSRI